MMAGAKDPFCYNTIEVPTVVGLLKNILNQYPDNGQIIKELVQNAEDAEASKMDVVHDTRKLQFPEAHQDIQRFITGPALCLYNDAVFNEEDWQGIRKLSDSIKKDDPLRVGQFGLGFKSAFHMTDHITILSGSCVLFMDPSEPEAKMCRSVALSALGDVLPMAASLQMWGAYLTSHHLATGTFPATLFWFPLRQQPSQLSSTIYSWDHVSRLFDSFSVEAPVCLTFLKALEQLSLKRVTEDVQRPAVVHQVELTGPTLNAVRKKRLKLRQNLRKCEGRPDQALTSHYHATILSTRGTVVTKQTMLVLHHLPGQNDSICVRHEGKNDGCHMPLVGVAAPTNPPDTSWARGHLFTFLPLPFDQTNTTDLPVQVNAYFTLDQNRRHVKWRTEDTTSEPDVTWNEKLVSQVVLKAYQKLLIRVLSQALEGSCEPCVWYSLLPDLGTTTGRWSTLARNLWRSVLSLPILHSEVQGFKKPHEVITKDSLSNCSPKMAKCVWEVLRQHKKPLTSLPAHVATSLQMLNSSPPTVTPQLVRDCLKSPGMMRPEWDRLTLLDYVTSDSKLHDLTGLPLLPLNNGTWTTFSKSDQQVFICTADQAMALWGLGASILLIDLPSALLQRLRNAAKAEITQLEIFHTRRNGSMLLIQCVQEVRKLAPSSQELQAWLEYAWSLIQQLDLDSIAHLPLLPSSDCPTCFKDLMPLSSPVIVQNPESPLSGVAIETLSLLDVTVVPRLPRYIQHNQLHPYLHTSDDRGVSLALACVLRTSATQNLATSFNLKRSNGQSQTLVAILDPHSLPSEVNTLLAKLSIFRAVTRKGVEIDACIESVRKISPLLDDFPVNFPETLLKTQSEKHHQLAQMLGAKQLSKEELCILSLENGYSDSKVTKLAVYIMNDGSLMANRIIFQLLKRLKYVPDINGKLCRPSELYNPKDPDSDALIGEDLMPSNHYHQHLPVLIQLGLRRVADLPQDLLERAITHVQNSNLSNLDKTRKSAALLRVLEQRPDCQEVCEAVRNVAFVYGVTTRPSQYPAGLTWATQPSFFTPASLKSYLKYKDILGSVMHLVDCSHLPKVAAGFGWNENPNIHYFLEHLKNILAVSEVSAGEYSEIVKKVYKYLSSFISTSEAHHLKSFSKLQCVFTEYGFKFPNQVFITRERDDLQLLPYKYPLPYDLRECAELFKFMGCFSQQSLELYLNVLRQVQELHSFGAEDEDEVNNDRRLIVSVLEKLERFVAKIEPSQLLLPVENDEDSLELVEKDLCSYSDQDCDWLSNDEMEVRVVHRCVSARLACGLGVKELIQHLVDGGEAVMEWGQHEPLTTRLHNLLHHYRDGVAIMKELVQNADDAGATSVSFLYDERQNNDARTKLLNPQLGSCQGPALWVYNDATFTENDFHNLRNLGAGTKESQSTKIGKFGLGFCSVYNLTDVPSFISGSNYVIFDPHQTYVDPENKTYGKRYNFEKRKAILMLKKLDGQFKPFHQVFDCNIQEANEFNGTLFRFPLRTLAQAANSKISSVAYGRTDMVQLLQMFREIVGEVLLYTQNVKEIKVFHLTTTASSPTEKKLLFESRKVSRGEPLLNDKQDTPLVKANALFTRKQSRFEWSGNEYRETILLDIAVRNCQAGKELCGGKVDSWTVTWMTSWHSGKGHLCRLAEGLSGKALPLGAVSAPVVESNEGWKPRLLSGLPLGFYKEGHLHCFLPLPVKTPLPLQVNGFFEVATDRTTLLYHTSDDRQALNWNTLLISDAVTTAYHTFLHNLISLGQCGTPYYALWPLASDSNDSHMTTLVKSFYSFVVKYDLKVFHSTSGWQLLSRCLFLQDSFYCVEEIGETAFKYMENMLGSSEKQFMVELPDKIQAGFEKTLISKYCVSQDAFYQNYFIPSLSCEIVTPEERDKLTLHTLDMSLTCMESLKGVACIPVQPNGRLRTPEDLIEPESRVAGMFSLSDERFPQDLFLETSERIWALSNLGMRSRIMPAEWVCDRAGSVAQLSCPECALARADKILQYIGEQKETNVITSKVCTVPFLPVMVKPSDWPYMWKGDQELVDYSEWCTSHSSKAHKHMSLAFASPSQLCLPEFTVLVGSNHLILQDGHGDQNRLQSSVLRNLGLLVDPLQLPLQSVLHQLSEFTSTPERNEQIYCRCHAIYEHLEDFLRQNSSCPGELQELRNKKVLFTNYGFMEPELFAISSEADLSPDLFSATSEGLKKYRILMEVLNIKSNFTFSVVMKAVSKKIESLGTDILSKAKVSQISKLLGELFKVRESDSLNDQVSISSFYLPDERGCLHPVSKLCQEDGANLSSGEFFCLHKGIKVSQEMLEWLGIKSKTRKRLEDSAFRLHFGQSEPLTTRLRNILQDYPRDAGIMKELLQNADDAGATEVAFIKDLRSLPGEKLFDKMWAPLQGPALSVYNNKGFTTTDLHSIQDLGNSSKREDPASTGQYGIGFNAVYHLTDAPSFLTRGPEVPNGEILCMFDPHCRYDPWVSVEKPGIQFQNLVDLRKDHPDSFIGYLENELLKEEGTVFRLPLRTSPNSEISGCIMTKEMLEDILEEFKREMSKCLLFLRNVRRISVMKVDKPGKCITEYSVYSEVSQESEMLNSIIHEKKQSTDFCKHLYALEMKRELYNMEITDNEGKQSSWCVVQQLGAENVDSAPEIVKDAFHHGFLNLLPHAGVALLLSFKSNQCTTSNQFAYKHARSNQLTTSCYLPLPSSSGLPFSVNGHFALSSRRDLWSGTGDAKAMWNQWLMKEVLVPTAAHALDHYRASIFPEERDTHLSMTERYFKEKVNLFHRCLPNIMDVSSEKWKDFTRFFYEYVRDHQLHLFDIFISESDKSQEVWEIMDPYHMATNTAQEKPRRGKLEWHAFRETGNEFPVYFPRYLIESHFLDTLKRLGMKVASETMSIKMSSADPEYKYPDLVPGTVLTFLLSWNKDFPDNCKPLLGLKIKETPFLEPQNVCSILDYVSRDKNFKTIVCGLPLLLTNDDVLRCFSKKEPVFVSKYCSLLPKSGAEFLHKKLVSQVAKYFKTFEVAIIKQFSIEDLSCRLTSVLDDTYISQEALIPLTKMSKSIPYSKWIENVWKFMVEMTKQKFNIDTTTPASVDWGACKQHIIETIGDWALYPVTVKGSMHLIPINNAWRVLDIINFEVDSVFGNLPIFQACSEAMDYIPAELKLAATKNDPQGVLKVLYFYRSEIGVYMSTRQRVQNGKHRQNAREILEYFGHHCTKYSLCQTKMSALSIFKDVTDQHCSLTGKKLIVHISDDFAGMKKVALKNDFVLLKYPMSTSISDLYKYIDPEILTEELDIYAKFILPNLEFLEEKERIHHLEILMNLLSKLKCKDESRWDNSQVKVVSVLKRTKFLELDGKLVTAENFYDPTNNVFLVMKKCIVPQKWAEDQWSYILKLAGMIHTVTPEMFVEFAGVLRISDPEVEEKSKMLVKHLCENYESLDSIVTQVKDIEFLVPHKMENIGILENLLPHHKAHSGLVSFSKSVHSKFGILLWSTVSLLPQYATSTPEDMERFNISETAPVDKVLEHITNLCQALHSDGNVTGKEVFLVMEGIYEHLLSSKVTCESLKQSGVPMIHIPDHRTFVSASLVVENPVQEILPFLYQAPVRYGKFYVAFRQLGMVKSVICDTYAQVLERIYHSSQQEVLNPEESNSMTMAMRGLLRQKSNLGNLSVDILYLPTRDRKLHSSSKIFVADNQELLVVAQDKLTEPLFVGLNALHIYKNNCDFVKHLPERLQPKFLSDVVQEELLLDGIEEISTPIFDQLKEVLNSDPLKTAILRVIHHFKMEETLGLTKNEEQEITRKLSRVALKQLREIIVIKKFQEDEVGKKTKLYHVKEEAEGNENLLTLYIPINFPVMFLFTALSELYKKLLNVTNAEVMIPLSAIFCCILKPHDMHKYLNNFGIKDYESQCSEHRLFSFDIGSYLEERFLHLLDNKFGQFNVGEIVCMKKYICENDDIFIIVKVCRLVDQSSTCMMLDVYEVNMEEREDQLAAVKAHQLYRFVRKPVGALILSSQAQDGTEEEEEEEEEEEMEVCEEELRRRIRHQVREIWEVRNDLERRHLLRRLVFRWHPDKNPERVDLCIRLVQYLQSLVDRLHRGETIPDDDTGEDTASEPSRAYQHTFRRPPPQYTRSHGTFGGSYERYASGSRDRTRRRMGDPREAQKWWRHADHDLDEAGRRVGGPACWVLYICHQAAEKFVKACLYSVNRDAEAEWHGEPLGLLCSRLSHHEASQLVAEVETRVGWFGRMRYPSYHGCPCDCYQDEDAEFVLGRVQALKEVLATIFQAGED